MLSEPSYKLLIGERHLLLVAAIMVVFVAKGYGCCICIDNAMIADSYFMCIAAEVLYYLARSSKGALGVYHPLFCKQAFNECFVCYAFLPQLLYILSTKHFTECFCRE